MAVGELQLIQAKLIYCSVGIHPECQVPYKHKSMFNFSQLSGILFIYFYKFHTHKTLNDIIT